MQKIEPSELIFMTDGSFRGCKCIKREVVFSCICICICKSVHNVYVRVYITYTIIQSIMRSEMCSLHLTHPSVHTWSSGQPTVQRPGSSRGLPVGAGIRTHNLGLPRVSSPTLYPLGQQLPKMAPRMAAMLRALGKLCSFSYVFLLFYVLDVVSITVYDRDTLLNIGSSVAQRKPDIEFLNAGGLLTDTASEPFVWVAKSRSQCRKRGKRAGVLVRLRRRAFRPPLPTILLANVQSLDNKLCELRARISYQRETRDCCVICLTETWMSAMVPDSAVELTGFSVHCSDRTKELTGKSRGGGVCFYINNSWCNERNIHSIKSFCSPDLEFHTLLCRPFWLPREFTAIIITAVYIPPPSQHRPGTRGTVQEYKWAGNRAPRCSLCCHRGL